MVYVFISYVLAFQHLSSLCGFLQPKQLETWGGLATPWLKA